MREAQYRRYNAKFKYNIVGSSSITLWEKKSTEESVGEIQHFDSKNIAFSSAKLKKLQLRQIK